MTDVRLLVSDVDGTLVRSDKKLSDAVIAAARRLQDAGIAMSLISARPPSGMLWLAEYLELTGPIGAFNGGTLLKPDGTILSTARLGPDVARQAVELIDQPGIVTWIFSDGIWHATREDEVHDSRERLAANQRPIVGSDLTGLLDTVDKIVAVSDDAPLLADLEREVSRAIGHDATVGQSQVYYLDITARAANKGDGVAALAAAYGVSLEQVAVIGDQRNDMAMFRRAGLSIAMAQGPEDVRSAAMRVTGSNDEDGVAQAIDEIILSVARNI